MIAMDIDALVGQVVKRSEKVYPRVKARPWTLQEDQFLKDNLEYLSDAEIGVRIDRSEIAVHMRWTRELDLPARSKMPGVITGHQVAGILDVDEHAAPYWVRCGFLPGKIMPGGEITLIKEKDLIKWAVNVNNWPYFDIEKVTDPHLYRLLQLKKERWGNEWWTTKEVANYCKVDVGDVKRYLRLGKLKGQHLKYSKGGRYLDRKWSNWYVKKSDALKVVFYSHANPEKPIEKEYSKEADQWLIYAREVLKMIFPNIGRSMKKNYRNVFYRYQMITGKR